MSFRYTLQLLRNVLVFSGLAEMGTDEHGSLLVGCEVSTSVCYTVSQQLQDANQANLRP